MKHTLIAILIASTANAELNCKLAPVSLYSVTQKTTINMKPKKYIIEEYKDNMLVNGEIFHLKTDKDGIKTYIRGRYILFKHEDGSLYIKEQPSPYTGWLICK